MKASKSTLITFALLVIYLIQLTDYYAGTSILLKSICEVQGGSGGPIVIILEKLNSFTIIGFVMCIINLVIDLLSKNSKNTIIANLIIVILIAFLGFKMHLFNRFIEGKLKQELEKINRVQANG